VCDGGAGVLTSWSQSDKTGAVKQMERASEVVMGQVLRRVQVVVWMRLEGLLERGQICLTNEQTPQLSHVKQEGAAAAAGDSLDTASAI
jgi:hypothetical protein